ncbi:hypothetical protein COV15_02880 [Candidatus Woesearchaeota archaeon CG10_big_fil_rev_8_21_14_0_10_34_12]|nr:MAG: hypothetical protein COV15_02880 [Candidatus Woesearchaeota archaeon CG10_big_fil_rev_8_21_14_0_10_34_12]
MIKILGILDILAAILFTISFFLKIPTLIMLIIVFYLVIKGVFFLMFLDLASILDLIAGILIFLSLNTQLSIILNVLIIIFLVQKGVFSLLS